MQITLVQFSQSLCASMSSAAMLCAVKPPLYNRPVTDHERAALEAGVRSSDAFTVRRCQIWLASTEGQNP
jgi:hypothetical protein